MTDSDEDADVKLVAEHIARLRNGTTVAVNWDVSLTDHLEADLLAMLPAAAAANILRERLHAALAGARTPERWLQLAQLQFRVTQARGRPRRTSADRLRTMARRSAPASKETS